MPEFRESLEFYVLFSCERHFVNTIIRLRIFGRLTGEVKLVLKKCRSYGKCDICKIWCGNRYKQLSVLKFASFQP